VFDRTIGLDEVPNGYRAMAERTALKVTQSDLSGRRRARLPAPIQRCASSPPP
jgi:hypothetical protein